MRYPGPSPPYVFCSFCLSGAPTLLFVHCVLTYRNKKTTKGQRVKKKKKVPIQKRVKIIRKRAVLFERTALSENGRFCSKEPRC